MSGFQEKKNRGKFIYSKKFFVFLFLVFVFVVYSTAGVYLKSRSASLKSDEIQKELQAAQERKNNIENELGRLNSPAGEEEEIRGNLNVVKPGESLLIIVEKNSQNANINNNNSNGFFNSIIDWIKSKF